MGIILIQYTVDHEKNTYYAATEYNSAGSTYISAVKFASFTYSVIL
jgi:hypothetical protein